MARNKVLKAAVLNIVIHENHSPEKYISLFKTAYKKRIKAHMRGDYYGILGWLSAYSKTNNSKALYGLVWRFTEINPDLPILDIDTLEKVNENPPIIPDKYKYNAKDIYFYFDSTTHRLYFDAKISPNSIAKFFYGIFANEYIKDKFGVIDVTIEQSSEGLIKLKKIPFLEKIEIYIKRPNPDDLEDFESELFKEWEEENIQSSKQEYKSIKNKSIKPSKKTNTLMRLAKSNGYVWARGKDERGVPVEVSTEDHPYVKRVKYDPDLSDEVRTLEGHADEIYHNIRGI